jgi:hypothetical protein
MIVRSTFSRFVVLTMVFFVTAVTAMAADGPPLLRPEIDGDWWTVAGDPDLGDWTRDKQQPVDFAVWQAADGSWQLWSCIRQTGCGGNTRLFYGWEGARLTEANWRPVGIAMIADPRYGEALGGLQAPHVIRVGERFEMVYGNWHGICASTSDDGKRFERVVGRDGSTQLFTEDTPEMRANTRDAMVLMVGAGEDARGRTADPRSAPAGHIAPGEDGAGRQGDPRSAPAGHIAGHTIYYCYYTAYPNRVGAVYCRTSEDLRQWSESRVVARGGQAGDGPYSAECPHVVARHGWYYLFRTQRYGQQAVTSVYRSADPLDFGVDDDRCFVGTLPVAAPEIVRVGDQDYLAALLPSLKGIQIARLTWVPEN